MQLRSDGDTDWAGNLVEQYRRGVKNISRQQRVGISFLLVFLFLVALQFRSSSTHSEANSSIADYHKKQLERAARRLSRSKRTPLPDAIPSLSNTFSLFLIGAHETKEGGVLQQGKITRTDDGDGKPPSGREFQILWTQSDELRGAFAVGSAVSAGISTNGFSTPRTAFSSLQYTNQGRELYTCDDRTGIVFEVSIPTLELYPRHILPAGDGNTERPFKCKWMAVKGNRHFIGSVGKAWVEGETVHNDYMWVKVLGGERVQSVLWQPTYTLLQEAVGAVEGYAIHESAQFSEVHKEWFFLPARTSPRPYSENAVGEPGRVLVRCDEARKKCRSHPIALKEGAEGNFVEFKFIPDGTDSVIVAIRTLAKVAEEKPANTAVEGEAEETKQPKREGFSSWLTVMTVTGEVWRRIGGKRRKWRFAQNCVNTTGATTQQFIKKKKKN